MPAGELTLALISCPECDRETSSSASACLNCGFPISRNQIMESASRTIKGLFQKNKNVAPVAGIQHLIGKDVTETLLAGMIQIKKKFSLLRLNGCGQGMVGFVPVVKKDGMVIGLSMLSLCFFFVPLIPLGWYLVEREGSRYRFFGRIPASVCSLAFGSAFVWKRYLLEVSKGLVVLGVILIVIKIAIA